MTPVGPSSPTTPCHRVPSQSITRALIGLRDEVCNDPDNCCGQRGQIIARIGNKANSLSKWFIIISHGVPAINLLVGKHGYAREGAQRFQENIPWHPMTLSSSFPCGEGGHKTKQRGTDMSLEAVVTACFSSSRICFSFVMDNLSVRDDASSLSIKSSSRTMTTLCPLRLERRRLDGLRSS